MKNWKKIGRIYEPKSLSDLMYSHASNPVVMNLRNSVFRIYFTCRSSGNKSSITFLDVDLAGPIEIIRISSVPVLWPGYCGDFDKDGVTSGDLVVLDGKLFLYYMGWNTEQSKPWQNTIGVVTSRDFLSAKPNFNVVSKKPVLGIDSDDRLTISYPAVLMDNGSQRMWYGSNTLLSGKRKPLRHVIKHASSKNGLIWRKTPETVLEPNVGDEEIVIRPSVIRNENGYKMFFCAKGPEYCIYSAESSDGLHWERKASPELLPSKKGWDSKMVCYPHVFWYNNQYYMLYCGNDFGKTGFGIAIAS